MFSFDSVDIMDVKKRPQYFTHRELSPVEQYSRESFAKSPSGWPSSQVSTLMKAQNLTQYQFLLQQMQQRPREYGIKEGMSIQAAVDMIKPRYAQSTCEMLQFGEYVINNTHDESVRKLLEKQQLDLNKIKVEQVQDAKPSENVQTT